MERADSLGDWRPQALVCQWASTLTRPCEFPYRANNSASFLLKDVESLSAADFADTFDDASFKLLAGCAPCQPFSTYSQSWSSPTDKRWNLLRHFARLVQESKPHLVTMENVPRLEREAVFSDFVEVLENEKFKVSYTVVNCADYGVPQQRKRLVLLASKLGKLDMIEPTSTEEGRITVKRAIGNLPRLEAGEIFEDDPLHQASGLSLLNLKRIRASNPGGSWRDWEEGLRAKCHRKASGKTYVGVYGRMIWNEPSPTINNTVLRGSETDDLVIQNRTAPFRYAREQSCKVFLKTMRSCQKANQFVAK